MVNMKIGGDLDIVIDMEDSTNAVIENGYNAGVGKNLLWKVWSGLAVCDRSVRGQDAPSFENRLHNCAEVRLENGEALIVDKRVIGDENFEKVVRTEKPMKKGCKKPPKPPRPPHPPSLNLAEQKLVKEISELAMLKKARSDRMKAMKKFKNGKPASSSAGNTFALVITLIFCIVILWQGVFPKGSLNSAFIGSPQSSIGTITTSSNSSIAIQFYRNASKTGSS